MPIFSRKTGAQDAKHRDLQRIRECHAFNKTNDVGQTVTLARNARSPGQHGVITGPARIVTVERVYVPIAGVGLVPLDQIRTSQAGAVGDDASDETAPE